ncbi:MAG: hypothetical protein ABIK09_09310 [Pseudomonadota bacterium]
MESKDTFGTLSRLETSAGAARYFRLGALEERGVADLARLPYSRRILLEGALRHEDGALVTADDVRLAAGVLDDTSREFPFLPARVVLSGLGDGSGHFHFPR